MAREGGWNRRDLWFFYFYLERAPRYCNGGGSGGKREKKNNWGVF